VGKWQYNTIANVKWMLHTGAGVQLSWNVQHTNLSRQTFLDVHGNMCIYLRRRKSGKNCP